MSLEQTFNRAWNRNSSWLLLLLPFSWLFSALSALRRRYLQSRCQGKSFAAPVVVIGNISVGGSGKTPLIIALVSALKARGYSPGVVSRGYGGSAASYPLAVTANTAVSESGDEPLLIASLAHCPVVVDRDRRAAVDYLLTHFDCDLVLSDDGLQHYRLHRDIELVVVDGQRGLGNGRRLPSGPLRESSRRLAQVDFVVVNGTAQVGVDVDTQSMSIQPVCFRHLQSGRCQSIEEWLADRQDRRVNAVAAIGNPRRFADSLSQLGLEVSLHSFDDHQPLNPEDLSFADMLPVIVTAKDAIKLAGQNIADNVWSLDVKAVVDLVFVDKLVARLEALPGSEKTNI